MAPSAEETAVEELSSFPNGHEPVAKRRKLQASFNVETEEPPVVEAGIPPQPLGIKPLGNAYEAKVNLRVFSGIFARLPDELLLQFLEFLDAHDLRGIGSTCKTLYAFSRADELWKQLFIESPPTTFDWRGTWRSTYLALPSERISNVSCAGLYSDALYRPFFCAHTPLHPYTTNIPNKNQVARLGNLTAEQFNRDWADKPFILTDPVKEWPVYTSWSTSRLLERYAKTAFRAEAVDWPLEQYISYMDNSSDESPLYLFDCGFVEKMGLRVGRAYDNADYWIPDCFGEDLFTVLGEMRPDSRWLIVGPERSGSTFHKDPNATSAWNAVLRGAKYWIMFPSSSSIPPPPGVYVSEDQSEVTSPLSIAEWLLGFHEEARKTPGCLEGICGEGEVLHVPSGWFHLVLNTEPAIAITQNFIPRAHLPAAISFLRDHPGNVSGFSAAVRDPSKAFLEKMQSQHPDLLEEAMNALAPKQHKKGAWESLIAPDVREGHSDFSFGFGAGDEDEDDIP